MEKRIPFGEIKPDLKIFKIVIEEARVPLYLDAAKKTGFEVSVTARAGEEILVADQDEKRNIKPTFHSVKVSPGNVEVAISVPVDQRDTQPFYDAVRILDQSPK